MSTLLTHYEITKQLGSARKALEATTHHRMRFMAKQERSERQLEDSIEKSQKHSAKAVRLAHLPEDHEKRVKFMALSADYQRTVSYRTYLVGRWSRLIGEMEQKLSDETQEVERLEAMYGAFVVPLSSHVSEPVVVMVSLMSGEMLEVAVDRAHPVGGFADQFAQQHGYHPSATGRMIFLPPPYEESEAEAETKEEEEVHRVFWSPEHRHGGKSIGDILGHREPLVHLLIRSVDESERKEKVPTLRKILTSLRRDDRLSDEALYDMYANWRLKADVSSLRNRYQKMAAFVEEHTEAFPVIDEEGQAEQARRVDLRAFREWAKSRQAYPQRAQTVLMWIQNMFIMEGRDIVFGPQQIVRFLSVLTVDQLFQSGVRIQNIPTTYKYYRYLAEWERYCREAAAEEDAAAE
jgi:hypothetical protein